MANENEFSWHATSVVQSGAFYSTGPNRPACAPIPRRPRASRSPLAPAVRMSCERALPVSQLLARAIRPKRSTRACGRSRARARASTRSASRRWMRSALSRRPLRAMACQGPSTVRLLDLLAQPVETDARADLEIDARHVRDTRACASSRAPRCRARHCALRGLRRARPAPRARRRRCAPCAPSRIARDRRRRARARSRPRARARRAGTRATALSTCSSRRRCASSQYVTCRSSRLVWYIISYCSLAVTRLSSASICAQSLRMSKISRAAV